MKFKNVREGKIIMSVPEGRIYDASVFYNEEGELNRDVSVSALQVFQRDFKDKITVCDALAASGVRGLRYAKEVSGVRKVVLNDKNPKATNLIKKNTKQNRLGKKCLVTEGDASVLLRENVFNAIDLDPFGSPSIFMDSAARSIYHRGFLAVTATDQSALAGTYPEACLRKYGIKTVKTEFYSELGVRILITFIISSMARYDRAFIPLLSFADQHYYRVFGRIEHAGKISELLKHFKYVYYCQCGNREFDAIEKCSCGRNFRLIGPVYLGDILDKSFCKKVLTDIRERNFRLGKQEEKLLTMLTGEAEMPAFYFDIHCLAKTLKKQPPKIMDFIKELKSKGFKASRTHFSPTSIKTDADMRSLPSIFKL